MLLVKEIMASIPMTGRRCFLVGYECILIDITQINGFAIAFGAGLRPIA